MLDININHLALEKMLELLLIFLASMYNAVIFFYTSKELVNMTKEMTWVY